MYVNKVCTSVLFCAEVVRCSLCSVLCVVLCPVCVEVYVPEYPEYPECSVLSCAAYCCIVVSVHIYVVEVYDCVCAYVCA